MDMHMKDLWLRVRIKEVLQLNLLSDEEEEELLSIASRISSSPDTFHIVLQNRIKKEAPYHKIKEIVDFMASLIPKIPTETFAIIMQKYNDPENYKKVEEVLDEVVAYGMELEHAHYAAAIKIAGLQRDLKLAMSLYAV